MMEYEFLKAQAMAAVEWPLFSDEIPLLLLERIMTEAYRNEDYLGEALASNCDISSLPDSSTIILGRIATKELLFRPHFVGERFRNSPFRNVYGMLIERLTEKSNHRDVKHPAILHSAPAIRRNWYGKSLPVVEQPTPVQVWVCRDHSIKV